MKTMTNSEARKTIGRYQKVNGRALGRKEGKDEKNGPGRS